MDRTYEVELLNVYEVIGGERKQIAQFARYQNLSYENLTTLQETLAGPVAAALPGLAEQTKAKKQKKTK